MKYIKELIKRILRYNNREIMKEVRINYLIQQNINSEKLGIELKKYLDEEIVISLTTHGKRINTVYLTIESLFNQTIKANKIILSLNKDEFSMDEIPLNLKKMTLRGLEINFCEDFKVYTKIIPVLKKYQESVIITVDDDVIYPTYFVQNLISEYSKNKKMIYFYRGHKIKTKNDEFDKYLNWEQEIDVELPSYDYLPTGVGGVLYPPKCFYEDVLKKEIFLKLCPTADDLWLKTMTLLNGIKCKQVKGNYRRDFYVLDEVQDIGLININVINGKNDIQLKNLNSKYRIANKLNNLSKVEN